MSDDPYRITDQVDAQILEMMIARLEDRGGDPCFLAMIDDCLEAARISTATRVLDLDCGTGVVAQRIAAIGDFAGTVTRLDLCPTFIEKAREFMAKEELSNQTEFETGDIRDPGIGYRRFDLVVMHTLVSYLEDPAAALEQAAG